MSGRNKKRVLIVEDDAFYRALIVRCVHQADANVEIITADGSQKAIARLKEGTFGAFDLVISDLELKSPLSGIGLFNICSEQFPDTKFMLISGLPVAELIEMTGNSEMVPVYVPKPFRTDQFKRWVSVLLLGELVQAS